LERGNANFIQTSLLDLKDLLLINMNLKHLIKLTSPSGEYKATIQKWRDKSTQYFYCMGFWIAPFPGFFMKISNSIFI